jgi:hypothetical protein
MILGTVGGQVKQGSPTLIKLQIKNKTKLTLFGMNKNYVRGFFFPKNYFFLPTKREI